MFQSAQITDILKAMNKFLPSVEKISQDAISYAIGALVFAYLVSLSPSIKALVKDYQQPGGK